MASRPADASIWGLLELNAARRPQRLAVAAPHERLTWFQLKSRADAIASIVETSAVRPGDRVCIYLPSAPDWVAVFLALRRLGLTGVSIGNRPRPPELADLLSRFRVRLVITDAASLPGAQAVCAEAGVDLLDVTIAATSTRNPAPVSSQAALIHLTSGSSGTPKGVLRTEADLLEEARNVARALELRPSDRVLCATPVYHSFASGLLMACLWSAAPCLLMDRLSPATLLDLARREQATIVAGVPYVFQTLTSLRHAEDEPLPPLRLGISGGAHLQPQIAARFRERFGAPLVQEYGLSEAGIVSFNLSDRGRPESVGTPIPNVALRIVDPGDPSRELRAGAGEVLVRRDSPPDGYLDHPEESRATFTPFGVRTGDLGYLDADGSLTLVGRIKAMINVAGAKVAPREVEDALLAHPALAEAIVFGMPHRDFGEAVAAVVVPDQTASVSESELIAHCRERLSAFKVPAAIHVVHDLPRTASGKPDIPCIRQTYIQGGSLERLEVSL